VTTTRLTLLRHAPTPAVRAGAFPRDEALDERGTAAASAAGDRLARADAVWTAPEARARQTARAAGLAATVEPALRDLDVGRWQGMALGAIEPDALRAWYDDAACAPHGGEPLAALVERVGAWLRDRAGDGTRTLAVTHAAVIRAAVVSVLDAPAAAFWRVDVAPLSRTVLHAHDGTWSVRAVNVGIAEECTAVTTCN
jgi:broad specificity phosphatase PhoE